MAEEHEHPAVNLNAGEGEVKDRGLFDFGRKNHGHEENKPQDSLVTGVQNIHLDEGHKASPPAAATAEDDKKLHRTHSSSSSSSSSSGEEEEVVGEGGIKQKVKKKTLKEKIEGKLHRREKKDKKGAAPPFPVPASPFPVAAPPPPAIHHSPIHESQAPPAIHHPPVHESPDYPPAIHNPPVHESPAPPAIHHPPVHESPAPPGVHHPHVHESPADVHGEGGAGVHHDEEKKGFLEKIKEKFTGPGKEVGEGGGAVAPPQTPSVVEVVPEHDKEHEVGEGAEKKGFLGKIMEKLPGYHKSDEAVKSPTSH